jgi:hypothetical protein
MKNSVQIIESTKYSSDYFFSLLTSKFLDDEDNSLSYKITIDFIWIINNTINHYSNPFYFLLISFLIRKKIKINNIYNVIFETINWNLISKDIGNLTFMKDNKNKRNKCSLNNIINYTILIYNIVSYSKPNSKFIHKIKILDSINEFLKYLINDPIIFSQIAYKYTYTEANNDKYDFKILLDMLFDILFELNINIFDELFFYKLENSLKNQIKKINNFSINSTDNLFEISEKDSFKSDLNSKNLIKQNSNFPNEDKNNLLEKENGKKYSIFFYLDIIYFYSNFDDKNNDDIYNKICKKIEFNKNYEKDLEMKEKIKFVYSSFTQYFLSKFVAIYILFKKEINNIKAKHEQNSDLKLKNIKKYETQLEYFNFRIVFLEKIINVLIIDMKKIFNDHEKLLNLFILHKNRSKFSSNTKNNSNRIEYDICGNHLISYNKSNLIIKKIF